MIPRQSAATIVLAGSEWLLALGWFIWGCGIVGGGLVAMIRARALVKAAG